MAIAVVQSAIGRVSNGTAATTGNINTTSGNLIVIEATYYPTNGFVSITDNGTGHTWLVAVAELQGSVLSAQQRYCTNITGKTGHNFTLNLNSGSYGDIIAYEVSGQAASPLDKTASAQITSFTANVNFDGSDTATTTQANELLLGSATDDTLSAQTLSCASPWTQDQVQAHDGTYIGILGGSRIVSATGAYHFTLQSTVGNGTPVAVALVQLSTWKEATGGGGSVFNPYFFRQHIAGGMHGESA